MRERTLSVNKYAGTVSRVISLIYLFFPILYTPFVWLIFEIPPSNIAQILLSPLYYFVSFWAVFVGYGVWNMTRWAWYVLLPANIFIAYESAVIVANYAHSNQKVLGLILILFALMLATYKLRSEFRVPYIHPRIPWWEMYPGTLMDIPVKIVRITKAKTPTFSGKILDINSGGAFVKTPIDIHLDERVEVIFSVFDNDVQVSGAVVWKATSAVTHPKGIGIKFQQIEKNNKRKLKGILSKLRKQNRETLADAT
ncbi:MAG: PilZ domain-containing protein [Xanthomonadaceae bacterium]|nr:PilZ domain-containing protein [Xanthomonadaceae bacterium]